MLTEDVTGRQRGAITAVCTDMHRPYLNAVRTALPKAEIVFDKFHALQHASAALDEVRRLPYITSMHTEIVAIERALSRAEAPRKAPASASCTAAGSDEDAHDVGRSTPGSLRANEALLH